MMATVQHVERRIEKIEGFRVQIPHGRDRRNVRGDKSGVTQYPDERAPTGSDHVTAWRDHRFANRVRLRPSGIAGHVRRLTYL